MIQRMTLKELGKALEGDGYKSVHTILPPLDPGTVELLQNYSEEFQEALRKGREYLEKPLWNSSGSCPKCGSKKYFKLFGGSCNKSCAECGTAYDCISLEDYLKHLQNPL